MEDDSGEVSEEAEDENLMENTYYGAKTEEDFEESLEMFNMILEMEEVPGEWGFKSLKQMIRKLYKAKRFKEMQERYAQLLKRMGPDGTVSRNDSEKAINKVLNLVSTANDTKLLSSVYSITMDALKKMNNEKLWFNTKLKLGNLYILQMDWEKLDIVVKELKQWCVDINGEVDPSKASQLLDAYVLEIQMYTEQNESKKLRSIYLKCVELINGAVVMNPRITGIIRECGGKMWMLEEAWTHAYFDFFEAFKSYDEAGSTQRIDCLKYLVLSSILMSDGETEEIVDPFDASETKPYKNHKEISNISSLLASYREGNIRSFQNVLRSDINKDEFMKAFSNPLQKVIRTKVLIQMIKPYTRVYLSNIAKELLTDIATVQQLAIDLILNERIKGHIDQVGNMLKLQRSNKSAALRLDALNDWADSVEKIHKTILDKIG